MGISGYFWVFLGIIVMTALYPVLPRATQFYPVLPIKRSAPIKRSVPIHPLPKTDTRPPPL